MKWVLTNKYSMPDNDKTLMHLGTENCAQRQLTFQVQAIGWGHRRGITGSLDCEFLWGVTRFNVVPQTFRLHCTCGLSLPLPYQLKMAIHKAFWILCDSVAVQGIERDTNLVHSSQQISHPRQLQWQAVDETLPSGVHRASHPDQSRPSILGALTSVLTFVQHLICWRGQKLNSSDVKSICQANLRPIHPGGFESNRVSLDQKSIVARRGFIIPSMPNLHP